MRVAAAIAFAPAWDQRQNGPVVTLEIRDLPDAAYAVLRQRARDRGQSLEAYMRQTLIDLAFTPTKAAVILDIERSLAADGGLVVPRQMMRAAREDGRR